MFDLNNLCLFEDWDHLFVILYLWFLKSIKDIKISFFIQNFCIVLINFVIVM